MYYMITLYPNYVHEFNYVKPIGPYHYHVLRLLISEYYVHWFDYNLMLNKILCLVYENKVSDRVLPWKIYTDN